MKPSLLESIIELTSQQDGSSLEACLMMTLPELIDCTQARLYWCKVHGGNMQSAMLRLGLDYQSEQAGFGKMANQQVTQPDNELSLATLSLQTVDRNNADGVRLWVPQKLTENEVICLSVHAPSISREDKAIIRAFIKIYANYETIIRRSERDKLTGLLNRNSLEQRFRILLNNQQLDTELAPGVVEKRAHTSEQKAWLALIDIDHFKSINDRFGHLCGDEVLLRLSQLMSDFFRSTDLLFRYGGEEFLIVLQPTLESAAIEKLQAFVDFIYASEFPLVGQISVSVGFTQARSDEYFQQVVGRADQALYFCKNNGRNQSSLYEQLIAQGKLNECDSSGDIDLF